MATHATFAKLSHYITRKFSEVNVIFLKKALGQYADFGEYYIMAKDNLE
jgi:hypothetical protein